ncbi:uncharacterized protein LOC124208287 isoform X2 [Daphnia pulex]|nr:uncharacterized protein LOC124208287 isoform X2 [Daphnia pulex]XP_046462013.1 uncharacterized protein LOC124208287 isoform X2 [Daphnia pulex]XP_046462014.1 uncharacterized protein LOC124208287 isoform X2 [Daphnia pulex]XP_046462015.1 uncharacterized protein LOC124208287 isoform X2 [Daphnia pulex]XP_046462016.1 uncharacterized protein LOC124208287 isoform X2 [Daphnia pulex]XP_046462017.1 uncharacterized protein LOC124208287 isoform X2 [Daphnia pulex]
MAGSVTLASRSDLFCLLSFLDSRLPAHCEVQMVVKAALLAANTSYQVFFLHESPSNDTYSAIVAIKKENVISQTQQNQKIWNLAEWSIDENALLRVYEAIDIDWKRDLVFAFNKHHNPHEKILKFLKDRDRLAEHRIYSAGRYVLDIPEALKLQTTSLPDEVYVKSLERHHAPLIYEHWTAFKHTTTVDDIADEIDLLPSAGLFLKDNDELVSWIMGHAPMGMSRLFTMDGHRRKGYATLVTLYMSKRMAQSGFLPFVNIVVGNTASTKFFEGLGFRFVRPLNAILTKPPSTDQTATSATN